MPAFLNKPPRPILQNRHPLARGLVFSCPFGWEKGFRASDSGTTQDDKWKSRGDVIGSVSGAYSRNPSGRCLTSGNSVDRIEYDDGPSASFGRIQTGRGGALCVYKTRNVTEGLGYLTKSGSPFDSANGWAFRNNFDNTAYEFRVGDDISVARANTGVLDVVKTVRLAGRFERGVFVRLDVDGGRQLEIDTSSVPNTAGFGDSTQDVTCFSYDGNVSADKPGELSMGAVYNRPLTDSEVQMHYRDPYVMWRSRIHDQAFMGPGALLARYQTFFLSF